MYRVRTTWLGGRVFITAHGWNDARRIQQRFGGRIIGKTKRKGWR